ncbi:hypothetical protein ONE63_004256 [Megalurothrips usitatus]|uniref:Uncharacterized protein n=1 Tax=Megalurothrips usitatus TaxID=439358 RepID=A0AAV7X8S4_9NEOP|nr:hypothetical protein ONE63_004256 [Megalurothrips usitatus]
MQVPLRELKLRRLWTGIKSSSSSSSSGAGLGLRTADSAFLGAAGGGGGGGGGGGSSDTAGGSGEDEGGGGGGDPPPPATAPRSLPLLQVWPSQDSPRTDADADGGAFVFPAGLGHKPAGSTTSSASAATHQHDSGIDSVQASPTPCPVSPRSPRTPPRSRSPSPSPTPTPTGPRRSSSALSSALLHPDHARLSLCEARTRLLRPCSPTDNPHASNDDVSLTASGDFPFHYSMAVSNSSSTASSLNSVTTGNNTDRHGHGHRGRHGSSRTSDPWLMPSMGSDGEHRRRSSTMTARFSLLDALDLDYALRAAAARGSVGPCSWSESLHKLTFTQSLAFPALARGRGLGGSGKRPSSRRRPQEGADTGLNAFAKVVTALVLVLVSVLVFLVVYKFVRT